MLITGGLGYIGSHTVKEYLENNSKNYLQKDVIIIDNLSNTSLKVLENIKSLISPEKHSKLFFYHSDCRDDLHNIFQKHNIDEIIHFAALKSVNESVKNPLVYYDNNINSLLNLLKYCKEYKVKKFVFSSSCSLYGNVKELPVNENTHININMISSPYAFTKLVCERILEDSFASSVDMNVVILRYFNPVGADDSGTIGDIGSGNVLPIICKAAFQEDFIMKVYGNDYVTRDGTCIRDYIHVLDLAKAHILAINYNYKNNQVNYFNLGSETGMSVLELIEAFEKYNNIKVKYEIVGRREGDIPAIYSDSSKAKNVLNWVAEKNIENVVKSAYRFFKNQQSI